MATFNLLPTELTPKGSLQKIANLIKKFSTIGFAVFIVGAVAMLSFYLINYFQLKNIVAEQKKLETSVKSLQKTEQQLILIRDRIAKAKTIWATETVIDNLNAYKKLINNLTSDIAFNDVAVDAKKTALSISINNSTSLSQFMSQLVSQNIYESIILKSFTFSQKAGYELVLETLIK
jgi:hypothetical protein